MSTNEKKGITVKIDAELHAQVREYLEKHEMTMAEFVTLALQDELNPKHDIKAVKNMGNTGQQHLLFRKEKNIHEQIRL